MRLSIKAIMFVFLNKDGDNVLNPDEFLKFDLILQLNLGKHLVQAIFLKSTIHPSTNIIFSDTCVTYVKSARFHICIEVILILNAILVFIQVYPILVGEDVAQNPHYHQDSNLDTIWKHLERISTVVYVVEAMVNIMVNGW